MCWNKNVVSLSSPDTREIFRPRSARNLRASEFMGPRDSIAMGWKMYWSSSALYFATLLLLLIFREQLSTNQWNLKSKKEGSKKGKKINLLMQWTEDTMDVPDSNRSGSMTMKCVKSVIWQTPSLSNWPMMFTTSPGFTAVSYLPHAQQIFCFFLSSMGWHTLPRMPALRPAYRLAQCATPGMRLCSAARHHQASLMVCVV